MVDRRRFQWARRTFVTLLLFIYIRVWLNFSHTYLVNCYATAVETHGMELVLIVRYRYTWAFERKYLATTILMFNFRYLHVVHQCFTNLYVFTNFQEGL